MPGWRASGKCDGTEVGRVLLPSTERGRRVPCKLGGPSVCGEAGRGGRGARRGEDRSAEARSGTSADAERRCPLGLGGGEGRRAPPPPSLAGPLSLLSGGPSMLVILCGRIFLVRRHGEFKYQKGTPNILLKTRWFFWQNNFLAFRTSPADCAREQADALPTGVPMTMPMPTARARGHERT